MEPIISQEELEKIMQIKGEVREIALRNHKDFVLKEKGPEGLKKVEDAMAGLVTAPQHKKIEAWNFYPIWMEVIELLIIKRNFDYGDEKIKEIGAYGSKVSFIIKMFFKYLGSVAFLAKKAPQIWKEYYTAGELVVKELSEKDKYIIIDVKDFNAHPIHCLHLNGYFSNMTKIASGAKIVTCEETKCVHRGDEHHEFLIKW